MLRWIVSTLFVTLWAGLVALITFLDLRNAFLLGAQPNTFLTFPAYWIVGGMMVACCALPLLPLWIHGYRPILRIALALGVGWLLALPFIPSTTEKALFLQGGRIQIGMSETQIRAVMVGYKSFQNKAACAQHEACLAFWTGTGDATVEVAFVSGKAANIQYATED